MTMTINGFSDLNQVSRTLQGASDTSRISLGDSPRINGKVVKVGVTDRGLAVRTSLLESLRATFGGKIPATVLDAMNISKSFSGFSVGKGGTVKATNHPLTVRRLKAIVSAAQRAISDSAGQCAISDAPKECSGDKMLVMAGLGGLKLTETERKMITKGVETYGKWEKSHKAKGEKPADELISKMNSLTSAQQLLVKVFAQNGLTFNCGWALPYVAVAKQIEDFVLSENKLPSSDEVSKMIKNANVSQ